MTLLYAGCRGEKDDRGSSSPPDASGGNVFDVDLDIRPIAPGRQEARTLRPTRLTDVAGEFGLDFTYDNGAKGQLLMVEATGGGCGWLDSDSDGQWDLYCCQGGDSGAGPHPDQPLDRLFRRMGNRFVDVTQLAGVREFQYSQGVAVADFDADGFDDVYVTNVGRNTLLQNQGDGTFLDITDQAGVGDPRWSSSAAWGDLDLDGDLDLYVCNYTIYDPLHPIVCRNAKGEPSICHPKDVEAWPDECYINQGDGTFSAESQPRGLFGPDNKALSAVIADFTNDGWPDIYVANDTTPNFFFRNLGGGTFVEEARLRGCAVDRNGARQASMGLAVGDYDNNGFLDIYSTHFHNESNTLYKNRWPAGFDDVTGLEGLHEPTLGFLAFGTVMADFDQDGRQEFFITNGHIDSHNPRYEMTPQLFKFNGSTTRPRWEEFSAQAGEYFQRALVGRGVATSDLDDDGDVDVTVIHQNKPLALLRNDSERGHWLKFQFRGRTGNRRGIGVRVVVEQAGRSTMQELCGGTSFVVTHQPMLVFGLGDDASPVRVTIRWPRGQTQTRENVDVDQSLWFDEAEASPPG